MTLDIEHFRKQGGVASDEIIESQKRRYHEASLANNVVELDAQWRQALFMADAFKRFKNRINKVLGLKKKNKEESDNDSEVVDPIMLAKMEDLTDAELAGLTVKQLMVLKTELELKIVQTDILAKTKESDKQAALIKVGNFVHDSVPVHNDEEFNEVVRTFGDATEKKYSHRDLIEMIGGVDLQSGVKTAGSRCYYLKGPAVFLEFALQQFGLNMLFDKDYEPIIPPFFMNKNMMGKVAQLSQFDDELYKVTSKASEIVGDNTVEEKYLIATSEQPIAALHAGEWIASEKLPIRYAGWSTCFRQEVGSHGRDTAGIFRVHQFDKIEQFVITSSSLDAGTSESHSWKELDRMIGCAQQFYESLGLPYRVVNIVSGALNLAAAKKFDLEGWFPGSKAYRELVSCSNCTDYQSRSLNIREGAPASRDINAPTSYVHMLNGTLCATTRVICCILENYQTEHGIIVPEPLRQYMPNKYKELIPFVNSAPIDTESMAGNKKHIPKKGL